MTSQQDTDQNTPTNTLERLLYEYRYDSRAIDEDLVLQQNPADVEKAHQSNLEETKGQIEAMFAQAVNKAELACAVYMEPGRFQDYKNRRDGTFQNDPRLNRDETPNQVEGK